MTYQDCKNFSSSTFQLSLSAVRWDDIYLSDNVDKMLQLFYIKLISIIDTHLKTKVKFVRSSALKQCIAKRGQLQASWLLGRMQTAEKLHSNQLNKKEKESSHIKPHLRG